jgi:RHS repeat-associated protein
VTQFIVGIDQNYEALLDPTGNFTAVYGYATNRAAPDFEIIGGVTYRVITDQLGSVRLLVNSSDMSIKERLDYDEFGQVTFDANPGFQLYGFAGGTFSIATFNMGHEFRTYDPSIGRWTTKDPIGFNGGDTNLYGYVLNDPVNFVDPSGLRSPLVPLGQFISTCLSNPAACKSLINPLVDFINCGFDSDCIPGHPFPNPQRPKPAPMQCPINPIGPPTWLPGTNPNPSPDQHLPPQTPLPPNMESNGTGA